MSKRRLASLLKKGTSVSPFLVLGDPTPAVSLELAKTAVSTGAHMLEIGFPYSDPVADGPAIQAADMRALQGGTSTSSAIELLRRIRDACPKTPLNLLVYGNLVHARGFDRFCHDVAEAGASSLLVPDVCLEESAPLRKACRKARLGHVQLVGPLTSKDRLNQIDRMADSFIYLVAHQGVTGVRSKGFEPVEELLERTAAILDRPLCLGFGLSMRDQIDRAFRAGARIAVVGSHLAKVIGSIPREGAGWEERVVSAFKQAVGDLLIPHPPASALPAAADTLSQRERG